MSFSKHTLSILRRYTGMDNQVAVTVMNKLGQEFEIAGYIPPAYSIVQGERTTNKSVQEDSIILRYADDKYSNIKLYASDDEIHTLNIKQIADLKDKSIILYENEDYFLNKLDILASVEDKFGDENYFTTSSPNSKIANALLGKVVICRNPIMPNMQDKKCVIIKVARTKHNNLIEVKLSYGIDKVTLVLDVADVKKSFYFVQPFVNDLEI